MAFSDLHKGALWAKRQGCTYTSCILSALGQICDLLALTELLFGSLAILGLSCHSLWSLLTAVIFNLVFALQLINGRTFTEIH